LAIALAECCILGGHGAVITVKDKMRTDALLFGESQSRDVITAAPKNQEKIKAICKKNGVPCTSIGEVKGDAIIINGYVNASVAELKRLHAQAIPKAVETA